MMANILGRILSFIRSDTTSESAPEPEFIAQQLRKPSGDFAPRIAAKMDEVNGPLFDLALETMKIEDNDSILEIGFGSGTQFTKLAGKARALNISGVEHSPEMIEMAREGNPSLIDSGRLSLEQGTSEQLPYPDRSFDVVYCNMVIYFWDRPEPHLSEIRRVLKDEGHFYTGLRSKESMLKLPFIEHGFNTYGVEEWRTVVQENGFDVTTINRSTDPAVEINGGSMRMESICMGAVKSRA